MCGCPCLHLAGRWSHAVCASQFMYVVVTVTRGQTFLVSGLKVSTAPYRRSCSSSVITWPSHLLWQKSPIKIKYLTRFIVHSAQVFKEKYEKRREEDSNHVVAFNLCLGCYWWGVRQVEEAALGSLLLIVWVKWKLFPSIKQRLYYKSCQNRFKGLLSEGDCGPSGKSSAVINPEGQLAVGLP